MWARRGSVLLLCLLTVCKCGRKSVAGQAGQNVTLPCKYNIKYYGRLSVCWGRGEIPSSGCGNQILSTDEFNLNQSGRYALLGSLDAGDVSLTILNSTEEDSGQYGCRVDIPGLFNDEKHHVSLSIERAPVPTTSVAVTSAAQTPATYTQQDHMSTADGWDTSSPTSSHTDEAGSISLPVVLVCALFVCVVLLTAVGVVVIARRWNRTNKTPPNQHQIFSSVGFSSSSDALQLANSRSSVVENIYQMEEECCEYEYCP
ncbi:hepatitis A virus cellular receptor 1 isoform X2 [Genypterus blacodes]|uniref:hepatitis A virus cellular receptor 1 isoform X2 n=1 Tax=Genypterus blacodes TaxID=154954 RepID=UPI003F7774B2